MLFYLICILKTRLFSWCHLIDQISLIYGGVAHEMEKSKMLQFLVAIEEPVECALLELCHIADAHLLGLEDYIRGETVLELAGLRIVADELEVLGGDDNIIQAPGLQGTGRGLLRLPVELGKLKIDILRGEFRIETGYRFGHITVAPGDKDSPTGRHVITEPFIDPILSFGALRGLIHGRDNRGKEPADDRYTPKMVPDLPVLPGPDQKKDQNAKERGSDQTEISPEFSGAQKEEKETQYR